MEVKPGYKLTEIGPIPEDWAVRTLGELGDALIGLTYKPTDVKRNGTLVLRASNIQNDALAFGDNVFVETDIPERIRVRPGDVLVCVRNGSRNLIGKSVFLDERAQDMTFGAFMAVYRSPIGRLASYLLQSALIKRQVDQHLGATINQITNRSLTALRIPYPPSASERDAVAAALSDCDALLSGLDRLITKKRDLKQAAMQQLLTGAIRLPGFSGPWNVLPFGEVAAIRNVKMTALAAPPGTRCVELESIGQGNGRLLGSVDASGMATKYAFRSGDVLFGRLRAYLRKFWFATFDGICSTEIWPLMPRDERLDGAFLYLLVQTRDIVDAAAIAYGTHMPRSDWAVLGKVLVALPPIREQTAIATVLSDMDAEIAALERRRAKTRDIKQAMMQELLTGRTRLV